MQKLYINPLPVRIWHWTNAVGFTLLILTGLQIRYLDLVPMSPSELIESTWKRNPAVKNFRSSGLRWWLTTGSVLY